MKLTLRPYQQDAVDSIFRAWEEKHDVEDRNNLSASIIIPTGGGKTCVIVATAVRYLQNT